MLFPVLLALCANTRVTEEAVEAVTIWKEPNHEIKTDDSRVIPEASPEAKHEYPHEASWEALPDNAYVYKFIIDLVRKMKRQQNVNPSFQPISTLPWLAQTPLVSQLVTSPEPSPEALPELYAELTMAPDGLQAGQEVEDYGIYVSPTPAATL